MKIKNTLGPAFLYGAIGPAVGLITILPFVLFDFFYETGAGNLSSVFFILVMYMIMGFGAAYVVGFVPAFITGLVACQFSKVRHEQASAIIIGYGSSALIFNITLNSLSLSLACGLIGAVAGFACSLISMRVRGGGLINGSQNS